MMAVFQTISLADTLESQIGGLWGDVPGGSELDVKVMRITELGKNGKSDLSTAARRSLTHKQLESRRLQSGDLVLEKSGGGPNQPVGRVAHIGNLSEDTICSNFMLLMRPNKSVVDSRYLHLFLTHFHINGYTIPLQSASTNIRNISVPDYLKVQVPLPPLDEQQRIVDTLEDHLSRLDKALAEVNHVSQLLKVQRSSLVHNLIARLKAENTPLKPLSEVLDMQTGPAFQSKNFTDASQGIRLLRGENIEPGALRWNNTKSWRHDKLDGFEKYFVQENDLILAMDRPVVSAGLKLAVVKKGDLPCLLVQRVARMRANGKALADYVYPFLLSLDFESHLAIDSTGTQIPHISMKGIGSFEIPVPSHERQLELALEMTEAAQSLENARQTTEKARLQISTLRRSILSSAFAGEL